LAGKCARLIFNLDELDSADWDERRMKKVIAPAVVRKEDVYHSVSRRPGRMTLLACVSAAGDGVTPMVITTTPIHASFWSRGLRQSEDVMVRPPVPADINEESFFESITSIVIPYVDAVRSRAGLGTETAILLMDSALPHMSNRILQTLDDKNIAAITFPAHTTNLFQTLDLVFFGALKK
jgi:hypothetical protein